jgi:hypothetical protein
VLLHVALVYSFKRVDVTNHCRGEIQLSFLICLFLGYQQINTVEFTFTFKNARSESYEEKTT